MRRTTLLFAIALSALLFFRGNQAVPEARTVQGPAAPVPASYFGMHVHRLLGSTPWPSVPFGVIRLWDTGTTWSDIEPQKGEWHFSTLDRLVRLAAEHNVEVLLCFGKTPQWASTIHASREGDKSYQAGAPANLADWKEFVQKVATRYKGIIPAYEVWNEPSYHDYYVGDVHTMVEMTKIASEVIHSVDPSATVVSPSATTTDGLPWFTKFLEYGGGRYVDVIGYHLYVTPQPPEQIVSLAQAVKDKMAQHKLNLPLWDTETGWSAPKHFDSDREQAAYVARILILGWTSGVSRFYWYAWDNRNWTTLNLTAGDDYRTTPAAQAFTTVHSWMLGQRVVSCSQRTDHTWVCHLAGQSKDSYILWNPDSRTRYTPSSRAGATGEWQLTDLNGTTMKAIPTSIYATPEPQLLQFTSGN